MRLFRLKNYPIHQELVSVVAVCTFVYSLIMHYGELPATLAVHFDWNGTPNGWSGKAATVALLVAIGGFQWLTDSFVRYQFLCSERGKKRFNWIQLLMVPGVLAVVGSWHLIVDFNLNGGPFHLKWGAFLSWTAVAVIYLFLTEKMRVPSESDYVPVDWGTELDRELPARFCLVDQVSPRWWSALMLGSSVLMFGGGVMMIVTPTLIVKASGVLTILAGIMTLGMMGGFRFVLHPRALEVSLGSVSIPLKSIPIEQITSVEMKEFNPLADYGGWGIRFGAEQTTAYIIQGNTGLLVRTTGRNYLLGTSQIQAFHAGVEQLMGESANS